jgi:hypothetical protein
MSTDESHSAKPVENKGKSRKEDETPEEKKARKLAIKQERKVIIEQFQYMLNTR